MQPTVLTIPRLRLEELPNYTEPFEKNLNANVHSLAEEPLSRLKESLSSIALNNEPSSTKTYFQRFSESFMNLKFIKKIIQLFSKTYPKVTPKSDEKILEEQISKLSTSKINFDPELEKLIKKTKQELILINKDIFHLERRLDHIEFEARQLKKSLTPIQVKINNKQAIPGKELEIYKETLDSINKKKAKYEKLAEIYRPFSFTATNLENRIRKATIERDEKFSKDVRERESEIKRLKAALAEAE